MLTLEKEKHRHSEHKTRFKLLMEEIFVFSEDFFFKSSKDRRQKNTEYYIFIDVYSKSVSRLDNSQGRCFLFVRQYFLLDVDLV